ncbi:short-chain dehydrogenase/reductase SDR [Kribbella flavida DSM 17836]|uniref:Probable oxidoreductase n=1 Tax=Kribbella flavida (strain DSM 17836 / JCM 10339 / NBRC 14399) TaxID=479435 RepID=D2PR96_KRIFD|nr:SDR family NAD(P)-dependent oxidoreductase [Kribbella flavida]ADB33044.1 short-chain dehydrogenase/reductase SDR [Kribbella flavida DSM 17836]
MTLIQTPFDARSTAAEVLAGVDLSGKRMIVTGGASGLGTETVRALAGAGAEVTVATRRPDAGSALAQLPGVRVAALDLADPASVQAFVASWTGPLHALVANAGIMAVPTRELSPAGWELQLATNFLGHFQLAHGLHDALRAAGNSRVVVVSSGVQRSSPVDLDDLHFERRPYDPWAAYGQSKTAGVLLAAGIARNWAGEAITANALAPGFIHTNLQRLISPETMRAMGAMDEDGKLITPEYYKTPEQGAATSVLLAGSPLVEGVTGRYFEDNQEAEVVAGGPDVRRGVAEWAVDPVAADRLWSLALETL